MTEQTTEPTTAPSKSAKWKRALIGGLLSAVVAGFFLAIQISREPGGIPRPASILDFISLGFVAPTAIYLSDFLPNPSLTQQATVTVAFWFIVGAIISYFIKKNGWAVSLWMVIVFLFFIMLLSYV